jgi:hypothetical protein
MKEGSWPCWKIFQFMKAAGNLLASITPGSRSASYFTTDGQSVCLGVEPTLEPVT